MTSDFSLYVVLEMTVTYLVLVWHEVIAGLVAGTVGGTGAVLGRSSWRENY